MFTKKTTPKTVVSYTAIHELSSGDQRVLEYSRTDGAVSKLHREYMTSNKTIRDNGNNTQKKQKHLSDKHYHHGISHGLQHDSEIYAEIERSGTDFSDYVLIRKQDLPGGYLGWSLLPTSEVLKYNTDPNQELVSGLQGVSTVLGLPDSVTFLWVSVERFDTTIALVQGSHILRQYTISLGTSNLVQELAQQLHSSVDFAKTTLSKHGLLHSHHDKTVLNILIGILAPVVNLIQSVLDFSRNAPYKNALERESVQTWVLAGIAAVSIPGFAEYLQSVLDIPQYLGLSDRYIALIQNSDTAITKTTLPKHYISLGMTALPEINKG